MESAECLDQEGFGAVDAALLISWGDSPGQAGNEETALPKLPQDLARSDDHEVLASARSADVQEPIEHPRLDPAQLHEHDDRPLKALEPADRARRQ